MDEVKESYNMFIKNSKHEIDEKAFLDILNYLKEKITSNIFRDIIQSFEITKDTGSIYTNDNCMIIYEKKYRDLLKKYGVKE